MKKTTARFLVATLLLSTSTPVFAADPGRPATGFDWSGGYLGVHAGYGWGHSDVVDQEYNGAPPDFPVVRVSTDADGGLAGIQGGYNWQSDRIVYGLEGELGYLDLSGHELPAYTDPSGLDYDAAATVRGGAYVGLSARLGYALDRTLLYGKAGGVWSGAKRGYYDICTGPSPCGNASFDAMEYVGLGYQLGAGIEHAVTDRWTIKAEYSFFDFGTESISANAIGGSFGGQKYSIDSDLTIHILKIGANYKF